MSSARPDELPSIPAPLNWGTVNIEPFADYRTRWPKKYSKVPIEVIETWIYRHWQDFQTWLPLSPLEWIYEHCHLTSDEVLAVGQVGDRMSTIDYWGNDLFDGPMRKATWLGRFMLEHGTTPSPMIIARGAGAYSHPQVSGCQMHEPLQLVEGHLRLAYLRALILRSHSSVQRVHKVMMATLPSVGRIGGNHEVIS